MRAHNAATAWLLALSVATTGCATQSTLDRLETAIGSPAPINIVGKGGSKEKPEFTTGGLVVGTKPYAVTSWKEIASTPFRYGKLTLLAGEKEQVRLGKEFATEASGDRERWDTILDSRFTAMADVLGGQMPRVDIKFRLVPSGVRYRFAARQPFNDFGAASLELLAVIPPSGELDRDWLLAETITAVHELFHVIRKDPKRFSREIAMAEEEIQAYLVEMCSSVIASHQIPDSLFVFPKVLEDAVDPDERDILIRDVYAQALEQGNEPTVVGLSVSMLAFFRYLTQLKSAGFASPGASESLPLCKATARDELHWAEADIDLQIKNVAGRVPKLPQVSRFGSDQRKP